MRILFVLFACFISSACLSRDRGFVGLYVDELKVQSIIAGYGSLELDIVSRILGRSETEAVKLKLNYELDGNGKIYLLGSSNSRIYLSVSTIYEWYFQGEEIIRRDVDSGLLTVFKRVN